MAVLNLLEGLNPEQREAVTTVEGPLLVHAGPGSGKTRVITRRIAYMVMEAGINPRHILAVTFSKKATAEMKKRLDNLLGKAASAIMVRTIHSACLRILRREGVPGLGTAFEVFDDEGQNKLLKECLDKASLDPEDQDLRRFKGIISYAKTNMIDPDSIVPKPGERFDDISLAVYRDYQRSLKKKRALDYDDMLVSAYRLLNENQAVLERYQQLFKYILVDEFQDTSSLQYHIIRLLGKRYHNVCVVGDPDQTIYSWRQAEIRNVDLFRKDFPGTKTIGMAENYRSTSNIVAAANTLIAQNSRRKEKKLITSREKGCLLTAAKLKDEEDEARYICQTIRMLQRQSLLRLADIAVLYRINAQSRALEDTFNLENIPYRMATGTPFYRRKEIIDMAAWLRVIRNPEDDVALKRVISLAGKGLGGQSIAQIEQMVQKSGGHFYKGLELISAGIQPSIPVNVRRRSAAFLAMLQALRVESKHISLVALMNRIIEVTDYREHLNKGDNPEERWENVLELMSLASAYEHLKPVEALSLLLQKVSASSDKAESEATSDSVTFNTLHGSKGTEFPTVFITGMEEGLLPHSKSLDDPDKLEEERRLCYVGITRAMDRVYLTYAEKRCRFGETTFRTSSRFIKELPAHLVTRDSPQSTVIKRLEDATGLNEGDRVNHRTFGEGVVEEILGKGDSAKVIVNFINSGRKKILFSLARLEKI